MFSVGGDTDIGGYLVLIARLAEDGSPFSGSHAAFWFSDKHVKKDDLVVLYTRSGVEKSQVNKDGSSSHFFYWGLKEPKLGSQSFGIVLVRSPEWEMGKSQQATT